MGLEVFTSAASATGDATSAELARRLFETGSVETVSVFSNQITIVSTAARDEFENDLRAVIEGLFTHYLPGVEPTPI